MSIYIRPLTKGVDGATPTDGLCVPPGGLEHILWQREGPSVSHEWFLKSDNSNAWCITEYIWDESPCQGNCGVSHSNVVSGTGTVNWTSVLKANPHRFAIVVSGGPPSMSSCGVTVQCAGGGSQQTGVAVVSVDCAKGFTVSPGGAGEAIVGIGTLALSTIPNLPASQITSGVIASSILGSGSGGAGAKRLADNGTWQSGSAANTNLLTSLGNTGAAYAQISTLSNSSGQHTWGCIKNTGGVNSMNVKFDTTNTFGDVNSNVFSVAAGSFLFFDSAQPIGSTNPTPYSNVTISVQQIVGSTSYNLQQSYI